MVRNLLFGAAVLCCLTCLFVSYFDINRSMQRRIYWSSACAAGIFGALATYPSWTNAEVLGLLFTGGLVAVAYVSTPYIKIRGKIYALTITDPDPDDAVPPGRDPVQQDIDPHPDSYSGLLTATTTWWLFLVPTTIAAGNTYFTIIGNGDFWATIVSVTFFILATVVTAYGDASWRYPIARGQYIQFVVSTVITAGVFYFLYVAAYYAGQRHPLRRKQSMEYRAHPRHRSLEN